MAVYEGSPFTILCIMVGIFALLNGEPRSDFSMRRCDLLHNHSCQLAHYGFCPNPLSDVRRALFFLGCLMKESSLSHLSAMLGGQRGLTQARIGESHWQTLSSLLLIKTLTPLPSSFQERHFLFGCSENIQRQYERSECVSRSTLGWMTKDRGIERKRAETGRGQAAQQRPEGGICF